jgi:hypothetical protein
MSEPASPEPRGQGFFATLAEAVRGSRQDFTEGPIGRAVFLLAVPMVLEMALESVFAVVDVFWVAKLGADAVATVGLTESMLAILYALAVGLSMGAAALVSRRIGEKDPERAATTAVQAIAIGLRWPWWTRHRGALGAKRLLTFMGASANVVEKGWTFTAVMLGGNVVILLLFLINAIFRGSGDAATAMRASGSRTCATWSSIRAISASGCFRPRRDGSGRRHDDGPWHRSPLSAVPPVRGQRTRPRGASTAWSRR